MPLNKKKIQRYQFGIFHMVLRMQSLTYIYRNSTNLQFEIGSMVYFRHHYNARALTSSNKWAQDYQQKCTSIYCKIQCTRIAL